MAREVNTNPGMAPSNAGTMKFRIAAKSILMDLKRLFPRLKQRQQKRVASGGNGIAQVCRQGCEPGEPVDIVLASILSRRRHSRSDCARRSAANITEGKSL